MLKLTKPPYADTEVDAEKRSYVDAILKVTGASRIFTQDIEEMVDAV